MNQDGRKTTHSTPSSRNLACTWPINGPPSGIMLVPRRTNLVTPRFTAKSRKASSPARTCSSPVGATMYIAEMGLSWAWGCAKGFSKVVSSVQLNATLGGSVGSVHADRAATNTGYCGCSSAVRRLAVMPLEPVMRIVILKTGNPAE